MKTDFIENLRSAFSSRKFETFFNGVELALPNGESVLLKTKSVSRRVVDRGLQFSKFSYIASTETSNGFVGYGFGESESKILSIQKSIAESVERAVYHSFKSFTGSINSNGWAAHLSPRKAERSALRELVERDSVLIHWLTKIPLKEIAPETFPTWLTSWINSTASRQEYKVRFLISDKGYCPAVSSVITRGNRAYISQGSSQSIDMAIYRALAETCRIISVSQSDSESEVAKVSSSEAATPWQHALHYAHSPIFPKWIFGEKISYTQATKLFGNVFRNFNEKRIAPTFKTIQCGSLFISHCKSKRIQNLFFGGTDYANKNGLINHERLSEVAVDYELNPLPHCVP